MLTITMDEKAQKPKETFTIPSAAAFLAVSPHSVKTAIHTEQLLAYRIGSDGAGRWLIHRDELRRYIKSLGPGAHWLLRKLQDEEDAWETHVRQAQAKKSPKKRRPEDD